MLTTKVNLRQEYALAEREGFEPPVPCGTPDFESGTFDHSATSPKSMVILFINCGKVAMQYRENICPV